MEHKQKCAYGLWSSHMSATDAGQKLRIEDVQVDAASGTILWVEGRSGVGVLVQKKPGTARRDLTGAAMSVRGGVGYGGGEFTTHDGDAFFSEKNGRLYRINLEIGHATAI